MLTHLSAPNLKEWKRQVSINTKLDFPHCIFSFKTHAFVRTSTEDGCGCGVLGPEVHGVGERVGEVPV